MPVSGAWADALCPCSGRVHGLTWAWQSPPPAPPLAVWVLAFLSFFFPELGVGVHVSSALYLLLQENWVPLGRKSGWILTRRRLLTPPGLESGLSGPAAGLSGFLEACFFPQGLTFAKGSEGGVSSGS